MVGRFWYDGLPSRFTLGVGLWNTFGGKVSFPVRPGEHADRALDAIQDAVVELGRAFAYRISEQLAFGGAFRLGIGLFSVDATMDPFNAHLSASGIGVAMGGVLFRPVPADPHRPHVARPLRISTSGSGTVVVPSRSAPTHTPVAHDQVWPQQVSLGSTAARPGAATRGTARLDRVVAGRLDRGRSSPTTPNLDQVYPVDWNDNYSVRLGGEYRVKPTLAVRGRHVLRLQRRARSHDRAAVPRRRQARRRGRTSAPASAVAGRCRARLRAARDAHGPEQPDRRSGRGPSGATSRPGDHEALVYSLAFAVARR